MRTFINFSMMAITLLLNSCSMDIKKREFYHFKSEFGYCTEWVEEQVDPQSLPKEVARGACPHRILVAGSVMADRYARCVSKNSKGGPEYMVFYTRLAAGPGKTDDITEMSPAEICKDWSN